MVILGAVWVQAVALAGPAKLDSKKQIEKLIQGFESKFDVGQVTAQDVMLMQKNKAKMILVDVREQVERSVSIIPGAISKQQFEKEKHKHHGAKIVAYCTIGYRSSAYVKGLSRRGFDAVNLHGSILLWTHAGGDLVDLEGKRTKRVHTYGAKWNLLPSGYSAVPSR